MRSPQWTTEEMVPAAKLAHLCEWRGVNANTSGVPQLSELLRRAPFHPGAEADPKFRSPNSVGLKVNNLIAHHPSKAGAGLRTSASEAPIVADFIRNTGAMVAYANEIEHSILSSRGDQDVTGIDAYHPVDQELFRAGRESGAVAVTRVQRERDPRLRAAKIAAALSSTGQVRCEVCDFDSGVFYGRRGRNYIEVHHRTPLHVSGATVTTLDDLALLCSNCHRMIHNESPWLTVDALKAIVLENS